MENSKIPNISLFNFWEEKGLQVGKICTKKRVGKKHLHRFFVVFKEFSSKHCGHLPKLPDEHP